MKTYTKVIGAIVLMAITVASLSSCYTIMKKGTDDVVIKSTKDGVAFEVIDKNGNVVAQGTTPATVQLKPNQFNQAYTLKFKTSTGEAKQQSLEGEFDVNIMYIVGDVFLAGAVVGFGIDFVTGKLFKMPEAYTLNVSYNQQQFPEQSFMIASIDELSPEARQSLIPIGYLRPVIE